MIDDSFLSKKHSRVIGTAFSVVVTNPGDYDEEKRAFRPSIKTASSHSREKVLIFTCVLCCSGAAARSL